MSARGMNGALPPIYFFDPLQLSHGKTESQLKKYREAEIKHGRIAMLACIGFLAGESPLSYGGESDCLSIYQFQLANSNFHFFWLVLLFFIGVVEGDGIIRGWESPSTTFSRPNGLAELRSDYDPGDLGFDPLRLSPYDDEARVEYLNYELQHGRLAMIGIVGMIVQELVTGNSLFSHSS